MGIEVNAGKTKPSDQNSWQNHGIKIGNRFFEK
jgi:hypothetical protein